MVITAEYWQNLFGAALGAVPSAASLWTTDDARIESTADGSKIHVVATRLVPKSAAGSKAWQFWSDANPITAAEEIRSWLEHSVPVP